ncbi:MAG: tRNA pseudouridine(55) synthase TruB [Chitinophagales bacterium]|nr:tRNA pseudouridine(55) synthase TruB [Chitinophagales bacterium]
MPPHPIEQFNFADGQVILVDKPYTWSSYSVVNKIKRLVRTKVGHAGTLDPLATGLMVLCTGKFTSKLGNLIEEDKEYTGTIYLGATRPSCDRETAIDQEFDISHLTEEKVRQAAQQFEGEIEQVPPLYSAIKQEGEELYKKARRGEEVVIRSRKVRINVFEITEVEMPLIHFRINCSKGTYIRSLARDFGVALGTGSHLYDLRRTKSGQFSIEDAWNVQKLGEYLIENKALILQHARIHKR